MNLGELKSAVLDTLVRQDLTGKPVVDSWVAAATSRLNEELLINEMLTRVTHTVTNRQIELPDDFIAAKSLRITSGDFGSIRKDLEYLPPSEIADIARIRCWTHSYPGWFTTYGKEIELVPYRDGSTFNIDLWYYGEIFVPENDFQTNIILTKYPQLYLNLMCSIGHQYFLENDNAMSRETMAITEIQRLMARKEIEKYGEGPLIVRPSRRIGGRFS